MESDLSDEQWEQIDAELFAGRKVGAIKLFREFTGVDLVTAKEFIDKYQGDLFEKLPDRFEKTTSQGCLSVIILAMMIAIAIGAM